jgi:hypothetical protein
MSSLSTPPKGNIHFPLLRVAMRLYVSSLNESDEQPLHRVRMVLVQQHVSAAPVAAQCLLDQFVGLRAVYQPQVFAGHRSRPYWRFGARAISGCQAQSRPR